MRGTDQDKDIEKESLAIKQPTSASDPALNYDHVDGSFEFGGIRVRLVTYKSIPGVIQINASEFFQLSPIHAYLHITPA